jgi:sugar transferase (PEP-CTERM/EpsH1 system associated)
MRRPRVGHVLHSMVVAGAESLVHEMVLALEPEFDFSLYLLDRIGPLGEDLAARGVPVTLLERKPGVDLGLARRLGRALRRDGVELVHAHQYTPWFYATLGAAQGFSRPKVLFTEHGRHYPDFRRPKRVAMNKLLLPFTDGIVAVSAFVRDCLRDHEGLPERRMRVLYNGIDPDRFDVAADRVELRREQGIGPDDPVVGTAARLAPVKDHATLLGAFREVKKRLPAAKLVLAGDGELREALESRAEALGIRDSIRFLGVRRDVPALLRTWDVFCLSSLSEGTSVTLLEAMASGLPAVVTRVGGNPEIVQEGVTGHTAPRGDAEALGDALVRVLRDPEAGERMGRAGRARVRESFTGARMIEEYHTLYRRLLAGERT